MENWEASRLGGRVKLDPPYLPNKVEPVTGCLIAKMLPCSHKERGQQGQPGCHGRALLVDNEPGLGLSLAASLWGTVRQVGKTWHAEPEILARMACSIREETKKPGSGKERLPLEAVAMLESVVSAVDRRELLGGF